MYIHVACWIELVAGDPPPKDTSIKGLVLHHTLPEPTYTIIQNDHSYTLTSAICRLVVALFGWATRAPSASLNLRDGAGERERESEGERERESEGERERESEGERERGREGEREGGRENMTIRE